MPPWPANPEYKRYAHEKLLSGDEIKTIAEWVDGGMPSGDTTLAPPAPTLAKGSSLQNPSLMVKMPDYTANTADDEYRCFVMPTGLTTDKYLTEIEVIPGNLRAVHHVLVFHDTSTLPLQLDAATSEPGYLNFGGTGSNTSKLIGLWVPGQEPFFMPNGAGILIEKKGYIVFQVHYPKGLVNQLDSTKLYMKLTSTPLREVFIAAPISHGSTLTNGPLYIPANTTKTFYSNYNLGGNVSVFAVAPHMHLIGRSIKAYGVIGTDTTPFIDIPEWEFHWQRTYVFPKIQKLNSGMKIKGEAFYDNTVNNPENPNDPPQNVSVGERTTDEMMLVYFWYMNYQNGDEKIVIDTSSQKQLLAAVSKPQAAVSRYYPVPVQTVLHLDLNTNNSAALVNIYALDGRLVSQSNFGNQVTAELDMQNLPAGQYLVQIQKGKNSSVLRVVKE